MKSRKVWERILKKAQARHEKRMKWWKKARRRVKIRRWMDKWLGHLYVPGRNPYQRVCLWCKKEQHQFSNSWNSHGSWWEDMYEGRYETIKRRKKEQEMAKKPLTKDDLTYKKIKKNMLSKARGTVTPMAPVEKKGAVIVKRSFGAALDDV